MQAIELHAINPELVPIYQAPGSDSEWADAIAKAYALGRGVAQNEDRAFLDATAQQVMAFCLQDARRSAGLDPTGIDVERLASEMAYVYAHALLQERTRRK